MTTLIILAAFLVLCVLLVGCLAVVSGMKWPVGKYNGQRIAGLKVTIRFNVFDFKFRFGDKWMPAVFVGPLAIFFEPEYEPEYRRKSWR